MIVSNLANPNQLYAMFGRGKVSELRREIERMFLRIQVLFEEKMEIYLTFGVSRPTDFPDKTCVKEAGEALRQRMISGSSNLYFYEDLQVLQSVVFPSVELKMLSQYLERGIWKTFMCFSKKFWRRTGCRNLESVMCG